MTAFHSRDFAGRFSTLGDPAEQAFLERNPKAHRLGLCRPDFSMAGMQATMRYTPDFMLRQRLVECMGIATGGQGTLKIKFEKLAALDRWAQIGTVHLWVWDSTKDQCWEAPLEEWATACWEHGERAVFEDNSKPYWALHHTKFPAGSLQ